MAKEEKVERELTPEEIRLNESNSLIRDIRKEFGDEAIFRLGDTDKLDVAVRSSGSIALDIALGGGWAKGRVGFLTGEEKSGKLFAHL